MFTPALPTCCNPSKNATKACAGAAFANFANDSDVIPDTFANIDSSLPPSITDVAIMSNDLATAVEPACVC